MFIIIVNLSTCVPLMDLTISHTMSLRACIRKSTRYKDIKSMRINWIKCFFVKRNFKFYLFLWVVSCIRLSITIIIYIVKQTYWSWRILRNVIIPTPASLTKYKCVCNNNVINSLYQICPPCVLADYIMRGFLLI